MTHLLTAGILAAAPLGGGLLVGNPAVAAAPACSPAGATGLTAAVVATKGQHISGLVEATGCDVGIYVGPAASGVQIVGAIVTGANDHGIFVQNATGTVIANSTVDGNGLAPHACPAPPAKPKGPCIAEDKGIDLVGTTGAVVKDNVVVGNRADGGIALNDDGALDPGGLRPGLPHKSTHNLVEGNVVSGNLVGCGIVASSYNPGEGVDDNVISGNTVVGQPGVFPPAPGGIILAGLSVLDNRVLDNTITGTFLAGIIVHSSQPGGIVSGTVISGNLLRGDGWGKTDGPPQMVGIILATRNPKAVLRRTVVSGNWISNEYYGIWTAGITQTTMSGLSLDTATVPVFPASAAS